MHTIAVLPGDGIGEEVVREGLRVLETVAAVTGFKYKLENYPYGAEHYLKTGETFPDSDVCYRKPESIEVFRDDDLIVSIEGTLASIPGHVNEEGEYRLQEEFRLSIRSDTPCPFSRVNNRGALQASCLGT